MKKVGIITFNHSHNLGGNLQAYATQKIIEKLGYNAEIIDYRIENEEAKEIKSKTDLLKKIFFQEKTRTYFIRRILFNNKFEEKNNLFQRFRDEYFNLSKKVYRFESELINSPPQYDIYLCGSDQIWNPTNYIYTNAFFLNFVPENKRKIAYASSIGVTYIPLERRNTMKKLISNIDYLSCREETGCKLIKELTGKDCLNVVDPTLLFNASEWFEEETKIPLIEGEYILCYCLSNEGYFTKKVLEFSKECKIVVINPMKGDMSKRLVNKYDVGPIEFVNLVKYSKGIITDSFHGMIFAINFNKPFYIGMKKELKEANDNSRKEDVLNKFKLLNRKLDESSKLDDLFYQVDYKETNKILDKFREISMSYLVNALK